uniref:SFRICE_019992 n=1 Tax=Spodoptera frugiperda TaxID=7108 RepID=A0A2H1V9T1_SPOFR
MLVQQPVFGQTRNGTPVITIGPYRYNLASGYKGAKSRWTCTRYACGCRSTIFTVDNIIVQHKKEHNHYKR